MMDRRTAERRRASSAHLDLDKPIYTLGVASEMLDAHPRTLMVYEQLDMVKPRRTQTNRRRYSPRDVMKLQAIQSLTRNHGVNLAGARFILALLKSLETHGVTPPAGFRDVDVSLLEV
ncbi:MAG: MerR family transcriptional regulator [Chloroflexi bacterium]|nr:MAG: MerR family transcriptional regulator [Chloroflexota bacterium]TME18435.1 MAG: MerR family transcriptional regulator [Chloroflexota bacterium]